MQYGFFTDADIPRQLSGQRLAFGIVDKSAFCEGGDQFVDRKIFHLGEVGGKVFALKIGGECLMVPGGSGIVGHQQRHPYIVAADDAKVGRRNEDHAVEVHPLCVLEFEGETGNAGRAVTFSNEEFGRCPAVLARDESGYPFPEVFDVFIDPIELAGWDVFAYGAGESCIDRVDIDDVGDVEDGLGVFGYTVRLDGIAFVIQLQAPGAGVAYFHPYGRCPRSAVKGNDEGAGIAVFHIGSFVIGIENACDGFAVFIPDGDGAGLSRIRDSLAFDGHLGLRGHGGIDVERAASRGRAFRPCGGWCRSFRCGLAFGGSCGGRRSRTRPVVLGKTTAGAN